MPSIPSRAWSFGLAGSLALGLLPLLSGLHSVRAFVAGPPGTPEVEQVFRYRLPWTQPMFRELVTKLDAVLPRDAALVCTPVGGDDLTGKSRWFLFLADALYPRRVFVRQPASASGTLMDYPKWVEYHFDVLDTDGSGLGLGGVLARDKAKRRIDAALAERGVTWELRFRLDPKHPFDGAELLHNGVPVPLEARP